VARGNSFLYLAEARPKQFTDSKNTDFAGLNLFEEGVTAMLTRIRHQVACPWIRRPKGVAAAAVLFAALSASSAFAQCRGGSGGTGGCGSSGGAMGTTGAGLAGVGVASGAFGMTGQGQSSAFGVTRQGQSGAGFFSVPSEMMFQPAFQPIVDDNRQYLAERRALRAAKVEQARQRLASRKERPAKHRVVAANLPRE
jgi:hypothetical protein